MFNPKARRVLKLIKQLHALQISLRQEGRSFYNGIHQNGPSVEEPSTTGDLRSKIAALDAELHSFYTPCDVTSLPSRCNSSGPTPNDAFDAAARFYASCSSAFFGYNTGASVQPLELLESAFHSIQTGKHTSILAPGCLFSESFWLACLFRRVSQRNLLSKLPHTLIVMPSDLNCTLFLARLAEFISSVHKHCTDNMASSAHPPLPYTVSVLLCSKVDLPSSIQYCKVSKDSGTVRVTLSSSPQLTSYTADNVFAAHIILISHYVESLFSTGSFIATYPIDRAIFHWPHFDLPVSYTGVTAKVVFNDISLLIMLQRIFKIGNSSQGTNCPFQIISVFNTMLVSACLSFYEVFGIFGNEINVIRAFDSTCLSNAFDISTMSTLLKGSVDSPMFRRLVESGDHLCIITKNSLGTQFMTSEIQRKFPDVVLHVNVGDTKKFPTVDDTPNEQSEFSCMSATKSLTLPSVLPGDIPYDDHDDRCSTVSVSTSTRPLNLGKFGHNPALLSDNPANAQIVICDSSSCSYMRLIQVFRPHNIIFASSLPSPHNTFIWLFALLASEPFNALVHSERYYQCHRVLFIGISGNIDFMSITMDHLITVRHFLLNPSSAGGSAFPARNAVLSAFVDGFLQTCYGVDASRDVETLNALLCRYLDAVYQQSSALYCILYPRSNLFSIMFSSYAALDSSHERSEYPVYEEYMGSTKLVAANIFRSFASLTCSPLSCYLQHTLSRSPLSFEYIVLATYIIISSINPLGCTRTSIITACMNILKTFLRSPKTRANFQPPTLLHFLWRVATTGTQTVESILWGQHEKPCIEQSPQGYTRKKEALLLARLKLACLRDEITVVLADLLACGVLHPTVNFSAQSMGDFRLFVTLTFTFGTLDMFLCSGSHGSFTRIPDGLAVQNQQPSTDSFFAIALADNSIEAQHWNPLDKVQTSLQYFPSPATVPSTSCAVRTAPNYWKGSLATDPFHQQLTLNKFVGARRMILRDFVSTRTQLQASLPKLNEMTNLSLRSVVAGLHSLIREEKPTTRKSMKHKYRFA